MSLIWIYLTKKLYPESPSSECDEGTAKYLGGLDGLRNT